MPTQECKLPGGPAAGLIAEVLPEVHRCSMGDGAGTWGKRTIETDDHPSISA